MTSKTESGTPDADVSTAVLDARAAELARELRATKRAAKRAKVREFEQAREDLGGWLADLVGVTDIAGLDALRQALASDSVKTWLAREITSRTVTDAEPVTAGVQVENADTAGGHDAHAE